MKVAVIGGGIQGTCLALELASRGVTVDLIEASHTLMGEASRHNEGKIHLGYVYSKDSTLRTAELQMRGAAAFRPLMLRWLGNAFDDIPVSVPFNYAVHNESLIEADQLQPILDEMSRRIMRICSDGAYFSFEEPGRLERLGGTDISEIYGRAVNAIFATHEIAVDPEPLADLVVKRIHKTDGITVHLDTKVTSVEAATRLLVTSSGNGREQTNGPYDHVVNCAWGGRPAIDATMGLEQDGSWLFRMKYFLRTDCLEAPLPSTTIVVGGFGDVVNYHNGDHYLCWYPHGLRGWSTDLHPPLWPSRPEAGEASEIARLTLAGLTDVMPAVSLLEPDKVEVSGGIIFALGETDIDDPASRLHERWEVGVRTEGWYHSVDTGKYTTAPLFAVEAADSVTA